MLLDKEFINYAARQLVKGLGPTYVETAQPQAVAEIISNVIIEELRAEDELNEEVRDILAQYEDYMRREGVSYTEMFRRIKNKICAERKLVRASGRETGDGVKISRDKVTEISHKVVDALRRAREARLRKPTNDIRLEFVRQFTELLRLEQRMEQAAREKVKSIRRGIVEGGEEFEQEFRKFYAQEMKKLGIDVSS